jgi:hypothetical protein
VREWTTVRVATILTVLTIATALVGCGGGKEASAGRPETPTTGEPAHQTAPTTEHTTTTATPEAEELTGWGATTAAWNSHHTKDSRYSADYNETSAVPESNGQPGDEYVEVDHGSGRVTEYTYNFPSKPIAEARADVLQSQLPPGTHIVWFTTKGICAQMLVQSEALRKALREDTEGTAFVEFGSEKPSSETYSESYDPRAVTNALIQVPNPAKPSSPSTAPNC